MNPATTVKVIIMMIIISAILFRCVAGAVNHTVGDSSGWDLSSNISLWSSSTSFFVNDSLVFNYTPDHDVIEVTKSDYATCRTTSPILTYADENGQTVILLTQPGLRYFVCGRPHHCSMGLKLSVQVQLSPPDRTPESNNTSSNNTVPTAAQPTQSGNTSAEGGDHDKYSPHSSQGYSQLNGDTFSRYLLQLGISILGILCILRIH